MGKVAANECEWPKRGTGSKEPKSLELFPPQLRLRSAALPHAVAPFFGAVQTQTLKPAPERGGGCECNEQTKGLQRGFCCLRQPLSQSVLRRIASSAGRGAFWYCPNSNTKPALKGEVAASATSRRRGCSEASVVYVNPSVNPPHGVLPVPRPGSLFDNNKKA